MKLLSDPRIKVDEKTNEEYPSFIEKCRKELLGNVNERRVGENNILNKRRFEKEEEERRRKIEEEEEERRKRKRSFEEEKQEERRRELEELGKKYQLEMEQKKKKLKELLKSEEGRLHAFIVGQNIGDIRNKEPDDLYFPWNDGLSISLKLKKFGYRVTELLFKYNRRKLTHSHFRESFDNFLDDVEEGDRVVVYFSGHGYQNDQGQNFLVCLPNSFGKKDDMPLNWIVERLQEKNTVNVVLLDCCQYNPKNKLWEKAALGKGNTASRMSGIRNITVEGGEFVIGYACLPGLKSYETQGGVFTKCLVPLLERGKDIHQILLETNEEMIKKKIKVYDPQKDKIVEAVQRGSHFSCGIGKVHI